VRGERGAGTVAALGLGLAIVAVFLLAVPLYVALAARHAVTGAADAAALAAADAASGLVPGHPCDLAARVAAANGASVEDCAVDGLVATVTVGRTVLGLAVSERASAGPAGSAPD
jgi:secretion/DNA translocation related TadE-like protein